MNYSGDAAELVVRISLEGSEVAIRLAGSGAKQVAVLLYAILHDEKKTRGKTRLVHMLRKDKDLKVFAVKNTDLSLFCREAKKYGALYCVLKSPDATDGVTDIIVREKDAGRINRIFERFGLATVDMASIKSEIGHSREGTDGKNSFVPEHGAFEQEQEAFLDALFQSKIAEGEKLIQNPTEGRTAIFHPSVPISKIKETNALDISDASQHHRSSVRQELNQIKEKQGVAGKNREHSNLQTTRKYSDKKKAKKNRKAKER